MKKTYHSRQLEGILCVDKPQDWTSFDVVAKMRGIAELQIIKLFYTKENPNC